MTKEDKQLLLVDLSARLPYGVKVQCESDGGMQYVVYDMTLDAEILGGFIKGEENVKPYLRPMSSMTEEELEHTTSCNQIYGSLVELCTTTIIGL